LRHLLIPLSILRADRRGAHRLRHTWATGYHRSGGSLFDLQSEGGWSDLTMVRRYARSTPITELQRRPTPLAWLMSKKAI